MAAMGSVEQNLARWQGQFQQPDGKPTKDRTKSKQIKVGQLEVQFVDISGTYLDRPGPFAPAVSREKYRMLAAILPTKKYGQYFFKLYGPQTTIAQSEKDFQEMIESFEVDDYTLPQILSPARIGRFLVLSLAWASGYFDMPVRQAAEINIPGIILARRVSEGKTPIRSRVGILTADYFRRLPYCELPKNDSQPTRQRRPSRQPLAVF